MAHKEEGDGDEVVEEEEGARVGDANHLLFRTTIRDEGHYGDLATTSVN